MTSMITAVEGTRRLIEYVGKVLDAVNSQNGRALTQLLTITSATPYQESISMALDVVKVRFSSTTIAGKSSTTIDILGHPLN